MHHHLHPTNRPSARWRRRRAASLAAHPAGGGRGATPIGDEEGSLVTEYGLLAVVAATIAAAAMRWASNGAIVDLFNSLLDTARGLVSG